MSRRKVDSDVLLGKLMHPVQLAILEAMLWIDKPVSPIALYGVFELGVPLSSVAYHVRRLSGLGVLEEVEQRPVRGAVEHLYRVAREKR